MFVKPQDILFILILIGLLWKRDPKFLVIAGLLCLVIAIPLFHFWIFFTAERFVVYATLFLTGAIIFFLFKVRS